ncbi:sugar MFS transporter [Arcicella rosea]|uniref:Fucose permease n=1 Tax=Arcicella rosea TaxID=502909 RepID=A0A841ERJ2_9BACT|nr:MFS transporter [Arcicella rosea]MBB6002051.1 fucose permease [Arcicella rosea]
MNNWKIKVSIFINYFLFAILLNSVGAVILQVQNTYGISESSASILEAFKDLSIAAVSFLVASFIVRIGYKNSMLIALGIVSITCLMMPFLNQFWMTKLLFASIGTSFALIKVSVYATIGLITKDKNEHISLMNFIESFFMIGVLTGSFVFSAFIDDLNPQSSAWVNVYYLLAGLAVFAFILLLTSPLDESSIKKESTENTLGGFNEMLRLVIVPVVLVFVASAFIYVLIEQSIMSWLPTFNSKVLHLPASLSIQMASILAASTAIGRFLAGIVLQKIKWLFVLLTCVVLAGILVTVALPLAKNLGNEVITGWGNAPIVAFIFPMIGLVIAPIYPAINSVILSSLPNRQHGVMSGLIVIFSALGGTTGSLITGHIFEAYGGESAFYFSLIPLTILIVCLIVFNKLSNSEKVELNNTGGH